ncbi:MAG: cytochrome c, partial [Bacteroidetes bacterium]|nr:cytochrome c [Bacteroidota bacterium]
FAFLIVSCVNKLQRETEEINRLLNPVPKSFSYQDSVRLINNYKMGMRFYKANCASCHGIFGKGKDSIPNFTKQDYDDYKTSFLMGDKTNHAVMAKMTEDQLNAVYIFLTGLKTRNP